MKRLLVLSLLATAAAASTMAPRVRSQQGDDFTSTLQTRPTKAQAAPPKGSATSSALPAGVEPVRPAPSAPAPNPYPLPADAPPFLICAAAFSGPDGAELARQTCAELREKHRLMAYVYNRGDEERKQQEQEWERQKAAYPGVPLRKKGVRIVDNYAVLVAGWANLESASEYLPNVKKLPMPKLTLGEGRQAYDVQAFQDVDPRTGKPVTKHGRVNPFHSAMVTRNPLAAHQASARPKFDPFWKSLNASEEYSLLQSRGKYTLLVKEYTGMRTMQPEEQKSWTDNLLEATGFKAKSCDMLDAAAAQAHELAKFLRDKQLGFKAFVLHTRNASLVTVGEFSGPNDPELERTQRRLTELRFGTQKDGGRDPIGLLPNPIPVEVPRP